MYELAGNDDYMIIIMFWCRVAMCDIGGQAVQRHAAVVAGAAANASSSVNATMRCEREPRRTRRLHWLSR